MWGQGIPGPRTGGTSLAALIEVREGAKSDSNGAPPHQAVPPYLCAVLFAAQLVYDAHAHGERLQRLQAAAVLSDAVRCRGGAARVDSSPAPGEQILKPEAPGCVKGGAAVSAACLL